MEFHLIHANIWSLETGWGLCFPNSRLISLGCSRIGFTSKLEIILLKIQNLGEVKELEMSSFGIDFITSFCVERDLNSYKEVIMSKDAEF